MTKDQKVLMDSKEFKNVFNEVAKSNSFEKAFGGWFKKSSECIIVLHLQKSNFGDYYELNIKIFIQGIFDTQYSSNKEMVKKLVGNVFTRLPSVFKDVLDFDIPMDDEKRKDELKSVFSKYIVPFTDIALSRVGLKRLARQKKIFLLPAVEEEL